MDNNKNVLREVLIALGIGLLMQLVGTLWLSDDLDKKVAINTKEVTALQKDQYNLADAKKDRELIDERDKEQNRRLEKIEAALQAGWKK